MLSGISGAFLYFAMGYSSSMVYWAPIPDDYLILCTFAVCGGIYGLTDCMVSFMRPFLFKENKWRSRAELERTINELLERVDALEGGIKE